MQMQQPPSTVAAPHEPPPGIKGAVAREPMPPGDSDALDSTPQVLARIPSLADAPADYDEMDPAGQSRLFGSRTSLKILAAVGGALFLLALWGFVFDRNKSKDETTGPVSTKEPFRPEVPAPHAPEAPRWAGAPASTDPRAAETNGPISAEARPGPTDTAAPSGPWPTGHPPSADRAPVPWTLSEQSASPASPAWNGQNAPRSEPVPDWTTQPYPSTADRSNPPTWELPAGTTPLAVAGAPRHDVWPNDPAAAARAAVNPVYRADQDPARAAPTAYTDPASSGPRWPTADQGPTDTRQPVPGAANRPVSLAQRPSLDPQLPAASSGTSRDLPSQGPAPWNWNPPADTRGFNAPAAGRQAPGDARDMERARLESASPFRSPSPGDYRTPAPTAGGSAGRGAASGFGPAPSPYPPANYSPGGYSPSGPAYAPTSAPTGASSPAPGYANGSAGSGPGTGYVPAGGGANGPAGPGNYWAYGAPQSPPAASPSPPSNPYHNLLPMYQAPSGSQPMLPASPPASGYRYGPPGEPSRAAGLGTAVATPAGAAPGYGAGNWPAAGQPAGGYAPASAPLGGNTPAANSAGYPPSYSLPVTR